MPIDILFYAVLLAQILLGSVYYPRIFTARVRYVLDNYSPTDYPKLYEPSVHRDPVKAIRRNLDRFNLMHGAISGFGFFLLLSMAVTGARPSAIKENQQLVFVMMFFVLQAAPFLFAEMTTFKWYRRMRKIVQIPVRSADLKPRRLVDFIQPAWVILAALAFFAWLATYLGDKGAVSTWRWNEYVTLVIITGLNFGYIIAIRMLVAGKKLDPLLTMKDQRKHITGVVRVCVFSSILMSVFMIIMQLVNVYRLDMYEPVFISLYFQLVLIFGLGEMFRSLKIETVDFDVYKADMPVVAN